MNYRTIHLYESGYCVKSIECEEEKFQASRFRYQVFCETLGWIPLNPNGLEIDAHIQCNVNGSDCGPLLIKVDINKSSTCFKALVKCQCTYKDHAFLLKKVIPM